jgi:CRISPR-associated endonuclease Csn1
MNKNTLPYTLGLDIGIASVGWAVLGENHIIDLGVRCFDRAETADRGESLNLARRSARLSRNRLRHRAWRLTKLARLLKREGLIADVNLLKQSPQKGTPTVRTWQLRVDALDRKLNTEEWARVNYHLCKHRGFHWMSRAEEKAADSDNEGGKVKKGLAGTKKLMSEKNYHTAAEMVLAEFPDAQRNKSGNYGKALSRGLLSAELALLFKRQRELGNPHASAEFEAKILGNGDRKSGLFWAQNPALSGEKLLEMLGRCTFERSGGKDGRGEYRAPKASFTAERHVWLTRLNNLRMVVDGTPRPLNEAERCVALLLPYQQASDLTYKQLGSAMIKAGLLEKDSFKFAGLTYSNKQASEEKVKDPEVAVLVKLPAWQTLRKTLGGKELEKEWQQISVAALDGKPQLLDQIAWVLSIYKEDEEVERELRKLSLRNMDKLVDALLDIRFDKFSNLSLKALYKIVALMEQGQRYDEAVANIPEYGHHSQLYKVGEGEHKNLPPFYSRREKDGRMVFNEDMAIPRNPVVLRALNQARKVVNAIIKKHGPPHEVHIEMARDLSRPLKERQEIKKEQEGYRDRNDKDKAQFAQDFNIVGAIKGKEFEKYQLYREQQGKCAYSIEPIEIRRLFEQGYVEIDHALPRSRSFDFSKNNTVLVLSRENRNKSDMTPYEYLDGKNNSERWRQFVGFVEGNKAYRTAKRNKLLRKDFGEKEAKDFMERNLNDTRYICKFFKNYIEQYLQLHTNSEAKRCVVLSGQMTSFLRARWGLVKVRSESDRHHALDAAVVAACSHSMVQRLSNYSRGKELGQVREGFVDVTTGEIANPAMFEQIEKHFPNPWPNFRNELEARLKIDDIGQLREEMQRLGTYSQDVLQALRPLFVSRSTSRRGGGEIHKAKLFALKKDSSNKAFEKVPLTDLTLSKLEKMIGKNDPRNQPTYDFTSVPTFSRQEMVS